jgi:hypothetical protein
MIKRFLATMGVYTNIIVTIKPSLDLRRILPDGLFYKCFVWNIGAQNYRTIFFPEKLDGVVY